MWTFVLLSLCATLANGARSCNYRPVQECSCWNSRRPIIGCSKVGLTELPDVPVNYVDSLDLSYNSIILAVNSKLGHDGLILTKLKISHSSAPISQTFPTGFFDHVKDSLKLLDISNNPRHIQVVPPAIKQLKNLEVLDLSYNNVSLINSKDFQGLVRVKFLYLAGNPIYSIYRHCL